MNKVVDLLAHRLVSSEGRPRRTSPIAELGRPRLEGLAEEVFLAALFAPAGYGKTTLMKRWQASWRAKGLATAWFTAEADHREVGLRERLDAALAQIDGAPRRALFIDDAHLLPGGGAAHLRQLIARRPPDLRMVVAGRRPVELGLSRLQLAEPALLIEASELSFDLDEVSAILRFGPHEPSRDAAQRLMRATEGWPAAVVLAAQAMGASDMAATRLLSRLPRPWSSLRAYVEEQLMAPLDPAVADFVLQVGALGRFTVPFAEAVVGDADAGAKARGLWASGLPLAHDPDDVAWGVFHPLFAGFLEERLRAEAPRRLRALHCAAAHWYADQGLLSDAVRSAFAGNDGAFAGELLARASAERRRIGRFRTFAGWASQLPDEVFDRYPSLRLEAACTHAALFEHEAARLYADPVRLRYDDLSPMARDDLHAVDAIIAIYADRPDAALDAGQRGLRACAGEDPYTIGTLRLATAFGWLAKGAHEAARQALIKARADHEQARSAFGVACAFALSGLSHAIQGRLVAAVADWREADRAISALATAETVQSVAIGYLPETLYEWNDIAGAEERLRQCLISSMDVALPDMVTCLFLTSARIAAARGEAERADEVLDVAEVAGLRRNWPRLNHAVAWERVRLALQRGAAGEAGRLHAQIEAEGEFKDIEGFLAHGLETEADQIGALRLEIVLRPSRTVLSRLRTAISQANAQGRIWRLVRLLILEARAHEALGNRAAGLRALRRALEHGAAGKMIRSFVDEGPAVSRLVEAVLVEERRAPMNLPIAYLEEILRAAGRTPETAASPDAEIASLSKRERDVLRMLAAGLSNAEIGARLFVSQHTVKWHLQHIYEKMGVRSRTQAVASARGSNLLEQA